MPQSNVAETTLDLCHLMRDLEVFACELLIAEEAEGQSAEGRSIGTSQAPLRDRLIRSGVSTRKNRNLRYLETNSGWPSLQQITRRRPSCRNCRCREGRANFAR